MYKPPHDVDMPRQTKRGIYKNLEQKEMVIHMQPRCHKRMMPSHTAVMKPRYPSITRQTVARLMFTAERVSPRLV